jgi:hypothetical protein
MFAVAFGPPKMVMTEPGAVVGVVGGAVTLTVVVAVGAAP